MRRHEVRHQHIDLPTAYVSAASTVKEVTKLLIIIPSGPAAARTQERKKSEMQMEKWTNSLREALQDMNKN